MSRLLVATSDRYVQHLLMRDLVEEQRWLTPVEDARALAAALARESYDLVVLDDALAALSLHRLRADHPRLGVLVLTRDFSVLNRVVLLEIGADDVVACPYSRPELAARLRALLRRRGVRRPPAEPDLAVGPIRVQLEARNVSVGGMRVPVVGHEFALLVALVQRAGSVVPRSVLLEECWGAGFTGRADAVDHAVMRLRRQIEPVPSQPRHLLTVPRQGYLIRD